jgi:hypothetical protein
MYAILSLLELTAVMLELINNSVKVKDAAGDQHKSKKFSSSELSMRISLGASIKKTHVTN